MVGSSHDESMPGKYVSAHSWFPLGSSLRFGDAILNFDRYNFAKRDGDLMKLIVCECMTDTMNEHWTAPCQHNESIKRGDEFTVPPFTGTWKHEHVVR